MKNFSLKLLLPHLIAILTFVIVAIIFCKPALEGKVLQQSDNIQWKAMYEDQRKAEEKTGKLPLWTNGMFSGMPGYQIAIATDNPVTIGYVYHILTLGMPKPFYFFILASICFYLMCLMININPYLGIIGALTYAYATYHPIIVGAGHETKMMALAYLPAFIGSLMLLYEKKYMWGLTLTALFAGLMISANHPQISYYAIIIAFLMSIGYAIQWIKQKAFKHLFTAFGLAATAAVLGIMCNLVVLATTYEYSKESIRGGSVLANEKSNNNKTGLNKDYALSYSFGIKEPLVMMFPRIFGGSTGNLEVAEDKSKAIESLQQMPQGLGQQLQGYLQFYWGGIGSGTAGPPYSGAVVCFLAIMGLSFIPNKHKWWMIAAIILTFMMSWGSYFEGFNVYLLEHLPFYNKFRAPSMIMVIPTFLFAVSSVIAAQYLLYSGEGKTLLNRYKKGLYVVGSVFILALMIYFTADFKSINDQQLIDQVSQISDTQQREAILPSVRNFTNALQEDRKSLFWGDLLRSFLFVLVASISIWLTLTEKLKAKWTLAILGIAGMIDLLSIDSNYLNESNYQDEETYQQVFTPSPINDGISKDTGYYRVFDISNGVSTAFNGNAITSVYHKSIGGYHAAKLSIYQDLIENQLYRFPNCMPVINMLNTKYIIFQDPSSGQPTYQLNPEAAGACWFVDNVKSEKDPAKVMKTLDSINIKQLAIVEGDVVMNNRAIAGDSIWIVNNLHDEVNYRSKSNSERFAVFSEIFYKHGWKAYVDGKETPIYKTNYVLRGAIIPAGDHEIKFVFRPDSFYKSQQLEMVASGIVWLLLAFSAFTSFKSLKKDD